MTCSGALVIFVKTPGLSPIKTRLAESLGEQRSTEFYRRSLVATEAITRAARDQCDGLTVYWAVAELKGLTHKLWSGYPVIYQGEGGLGLRLSNVYQQILQRHSFACFIGADSPHLELNQLVQGIRETECSHFIIGESDDGGFYFFGGSLPIPEIDWTSVRYSTSTTAEELTSRLSKHGSVLKIRNSFDIDTAEDLKRYLGDEIRTAKLLPEQLELVRWSQTILKEFSVKWAER